MGCDIHMYVEYKDKRSNYWRGFCGRINPDRNYGMFSILAGVRGSIDNGFKPKGIKDLDLSFNTDNELFMFISDDKPGDNEVTMEKALYFNEKFNCKLKFNNDIPYAVECPDWHSHSWMTRKELSEAYKIYKKLHKKEWGTYELPIEYQAILDIMKRLEKKGENDVRLVFWFDN